MRTIPKIVYKYKDRTSEDTIIFTDYHYTVERYIPEDVLHVGVKEGQYYKFKRGYRGEYAIVWDKLTEADYVRMLVLFDKNVEYIKYYPSKDDPFWAEVIIVDEVSIEDHYFYGGKFELVFKSLKRLEAIPLTDADRWGSKTKTFEDTTTRRGTSWNYIMTEQNNKDIALNDYIQDVKNMFSTHNHDDRYYTKTEVDALSNGMVALAYSDTLGVNSKVAYAEEIFNYYQQITGVKAKIVGFGIASSISGEKYQVNISNSPIDINNTDKVKLFLQKDSFDRWSLHIYKNGAVVYTWNFWGYISNSNYILTVFLQT